MTQVRLCDVCAAVIERYSPRGELAVHGPGGTNVYDLCEGCTLRNSCATVWH